MNPRLSFAIFFLGIVIGGAVVHNLKPKQDPPAALPAVAQNQSQSCVASLKKHTNADGSVDEVLSFTATSAQDQKLTPPAPASKMLGIGVALFTDKQFQARYKYAEAEIFGIKFESSIIGKIDKVDDLSSNKAAGVEFNF